MSAGVMTAARPEPPISNGRLGMMLLIGTETVLFTCFIGAYLVLRMGAPIWPPLETPILEPGLSIVNTILLVFSSFLAASFRYALRRGRFRLTRHLVSATLALGVLFLCLQGIEFERLYSRGLTLKTGPYGAVFYSLISCHGLHVLGGLAIFAYTLKFVIPAKAGIQHDKSQWIPAYAGMTEKLGHAELYWHFVTAVWLVLFTLLYIL